MGAPVSTVLDRLHGTKESAGGWVARCPAHDDQHQSLKVDERPDGSVLMHCHAGCAKDEILKAMGLTFADLFATEAPKTNKPQIVKVYDYRSVDGALLYQSLRLEPKEFRQRRPDGNGGWAWNMATLKGKHVAYRLPDLKGHNVVVVVEGEKDADALWAIGIPATTNIGGALKWGKSETKSLLQAGVTRVAIIPDNDDAGQRHADLVMASAKEHGLVASQIKLPGLPPKGDVSDWLAMGGTKEKLEALMAIFVMPSQPMIAPQAAPDPPALPADALNVGSYHLTDLGAAESLRDRYGDMLRYDHQQNRWLLWDGHYWKPDLDEEASRMAHTHVRKMQMEAATFVGDFVLRQHCIEFARKREQTGPMKAMMQHATALKPMAIAGDSWDSKHFLLGCPNGVIDLTTGMLRDGERDDFITLRTGVPYSHADAPRWEQFLLEIFDGDLELIDYIWRAVGYSLTGDMREQCFFVMYGHGSNGKSLFIDALEHVFGTYGYRADMRMFAGQGDISNSFQMADFRGKRLVFAAEVRANSKMNEHVLKHFTGGESVRAEHKYGRSFTIEPIGKIWLGVNHRPKVADDSFGFWRRVRLIPFLRTFTGPTADPMLKQILRTEASGILAWAVAGCLEWQQRGLVAPQVVQDATNEYQQGEDPLAEFFTACTSTGPEYADTVVPFAKLYAAYRRWATEQGFQDREKLSTKAFSTALQGRPYERIRFNSSIAYKGLSVD